MALLLYLTVASLSLVAARRVIGVLSWPCALVLLLIPAPFVGEDLLTGRVVMPLDLHYNTVPLRVMREELGLDEAARSVSRHDLAFQMIPWRYAVRQAIARGEWPLLVQAMACGDVLAAADQPAVYSPVQILGLLLPFGPDHTFAAACLLFMAGLSSFLWLRDLGCRELTALFGALGWAYNGMIMFWFAWPLAFAMAPFPLLAMGARRVVKRPVSASFWLLLSGLLLTVLSGHLETALQCVLAAAVLGLAQLLADRKRALWRPLGLAGLAGGAALGLAAVHLLPFVEAVLQSQAYQLRSGASTPGVSLSEALDRSRVVIAPFLTGRPWGEWVRDFHTWFAGVGSALLGAAAYGLWRGHWRGRWLLAILGFFGLLLFVDAPGIGSALERLPGLELVNNSRFVFLVGFALSSLAAMGVEAWCRRVEQGREEQGGGRRSCVPLVAVATTFFLVTSACLVAWWGDLTARFSSDYLWSQVALLLIPAALVPVLIAVVRSPRLALMGLLALVAAQRVAQDGGAISSYPRAFLAPPVPVLEALPDDPEPYRIAARRADLKPNLATLYDLQDVRGSSAMVFMRLFETWPLWTEGRINRLEQLVDLDRPFVDFLNLRFAVLRPGSSRPRGFVRSVETPAGELWENTEVIPRAFVPQSVRLVRNGRLALRQMKEETDFFARAWIEMPDLPGASPFEERTNGPGVVRALQPRGSGFRLDVDLEATAWVVVSQAAWRGWRARRGDEEIELHFANHAFLGFELPAGSHRVELFYRPRSFELGLGITLATMISVAGSALWHRRNRRRRGRIPQRERSALDPSPRGERTSPNGGASLVLPE